MYCICTCFVHVVRKVCLHVLACTCALSLQLQCHLGMKWRDCIRASDSVDIFTIAICFQILRYDNRIWTVAIYML